MAAEPQTWDAPIGGSREQWLAWANALPLAEALGMTCTDIGAGQATFRMEAAPLAANPNGSVNGGLVAAAADQCMGAVGMTLLPPGFVVNTATLHAQYQRPAIPPLTLTARVTKSGRSLIYVDVDIDDGRGRLCNSAQGTMMIVAFVSAAER